MTDRAEAITAAVDRLRTAAEKGQPCAPVRELLGTADIDAAYRVQRGLTEHRLAAGAVVRPQDRPHLAGRAAAARRRPARLRRALRRHGRRRRRRGAHRRLLQPKVGGGDRLRARRRT